MTTDENPVAGEFVDDDEFEAFVQHNMNHVETVFSDFEEPDDDLMFTAIFDCAEGLILANGSLLLDSEENKERLSEELAKIARDSKPTRYGLLTSNWVVKWEQTGKEYRKWRDNNPGASLETHPEAVEIIMALACDWTGRTQAWTAEIKRDGVNPPTLGEWESMGDGNWLGKSIMSGRFIDPIMMEITGAARRRDEAIHEIAKEVMPTDFSDALHASMIEMFGGEENIPDDPTTLTPEQAQQLVESLRNKLGDKVDKLFDQARERVSERMRSLG